jgi:hypothetical protein
MAGRPVLNELDDALAVGSRAPTDAAGRERRGGEEEVPQRPAPATNPQAPRGTARSDRGGRSKSPRQQSTRSSRRLGSTTAGEATDVPDRATPPPRGERRKLVAMRLMPGIVARFDGFEEELNRHGRRVTLTQLWTAAIERALPEDPDAALALRHRWEALERSRAENPNPYRGQEPADVSVRLPVELIARLDRLTRNAHRVAGFSRNGRSALINAGLHFHGPAGADEALAWWEAYEAAQPASAATADAALSDTAA